MYKKALGPKKELEKFAETYQDGGMVKKPEFFDFRGLATNLFEVQFENISELNLTQPNLVKILEIQKYP